MSTQASTIEYLLQQLTPVQATARKMFGEYAVYCQEKVVGFVCDDQFLVKPTEEGKAFLGSYEEAAPYPGAKMYLLITEDNWEDRDWLCELVRITERVVPFSKKKTKKAKAA